MNGPDAWCYDALELPRVFANGFAATTILRSLEVIETFFDHNPAMHTTILSSRVPIEQYLATAAADDEVARHLREHRTPGPTTLLVLESERPIAWWTIDGAAPNAIPRSVPGDPAGGVIDETGGTPVLYRAGVTPGSHIVQYELESGERREQTIDVTKGLRNRLVS